MGNATSSDTLLDIGGYIQVPDYVPAQHCRHWEHTILQNRRLWLKRLGGYSFGHGWYLDLESGRLDQYHATAVRSNELLHRTLPGFLDDLKAFARHLVGPDGATNLPARARRENLGPYWCDAGVHILGGDVAREYPGGAPHADFEGLSPYVPAMFDQATRAYSAILSIATPAWGIGLDIWTHRRYTPDAFPHDIFARSGEPTIPPVSLRYAVGTMTGLDSFLYHGLQKGGYSAERPWRIVGVIHFLYRRDPYPHWEHWF